MTYQTLKYYCNEGLVSHVKRDRNNRRVFDERDVQWIKSLVCLKKCGMSIQKMKEYLALCLQGKSTIRELEKSITFIDWKRNFYDEVLAGKRPYTSNLIRTEE